MTKVFAPGSVEKRALAIVAYLESHSNSTEKQILKAVPGKKQIFVRALRDLLNRREIARIGSGKRGDPFLYSQVAKEPYCNDLNGSSARGLDGLDVEACSEETGGEDLNPKPASGDQ